MEELDEETESMSTNFRAKPVEEEGAKLGIMPRDPYRRSQQSERRSRRGSDMAEED